MRDKDAGVTVMNSKHTARTATTMAQQAQDPQVQQQSSPSAATKVFSTFELLEPILIHASESQSRESMQLLLSVQRICRSAYDTVKISKPLQQRLWYSPTLPGGGANSLFMTPSNKAPFFITGGSLSDAKSVTVRWANIAKAEGSESWRSMVVLSDAEVYSIRMWSGQGMVVLQPTFTKATMTGEELLIECERLKGADTMMDESYPGARTQEHSKRKARRSRY